MARMQKLETHRWTREAYDRMIDHGVFGPDERAELIDGEILEMTPIGSRRLLGLAARSQGVGDSHFRSHPLFPMLYLFFEAHELESYQ